MEVHLEARDKAIKKLKVADHMLTVTYPLVKDPKLLLAVMDNVFLSLTNTMAAFLHFDQKYKRVPMFQDNFESKFDLFRQKAESYRVDRGYLVMIQEIKETIVAHRKAPVEFRKKDQLVICNEQYQFKTINTEKMQDYIDKTRDVIRRLDRHLQNG